MGKTFKLLSALLIFISFSFTAFSQNMSRKAYIEKYKDIAIRQMNIYGIPASIIMAQACLESGNGNSPLAVKANNHFGIKCHNWTGKTYRHDDDKKRECFRKYNSAEDSFKDHSEFLKTGKRYQFLFSYDKTDYVAWAKGLKKAGYATNPKYADMLIKIIEDNNLSQLDSPVSSKIDKRKQKAEKRAERRRQKEERKRMVKEVDAKALQSTEISNPQPIEGSNSYKHTLERMQYFNNGAKYVISLEGESYASIAKDYDLFTREILSFNDLASEIFLKEGSVVYITPKRNRCQQKTYVVQEGETLYSISQKQGIKLKKLYLHNNFDRDEPIKAGTIIYLK